MDRKLLELLSSFINDPYTQECLEAYSAYRVAVLHKTLENPMSTLDAIRVTQGQIIEARRLEKLRDEINGEIKRL